MNDKKDHFHCKFSNVKINTGCPKFKCQKLLETCKGLTKTNCKRKSPLEICSFLEKQISKKKEKKKFPVSHLFTYACSCYYLFYHLVIYYGLLPSSNISSNTIYYHLSLPIQWYYNRDTTVSTTQIAVKHCSNDWISQLLPRVDRRWINLPGKRKKNFLVPLHCSSLPFWRKWSRNEQNPLKDF